MRKGSETDMQMLKEAILEKGKAINQDVLLVDSFLKVWDLERTA